MLVGLRILGLDHAAEGGHLDHLLAEHHMHQLEAPPDDARTAEHAAHLLRRGIGRHIEILGDTIQQQIAHRTAHHIGLIACRLQPVGDFQRAVADLLARHAMQFERDHLGISYRSGFGRLAEYTLEEFFDHAIFNRALPEWNATRSCRERGLYSPQEKRALRRVPGVFRLSEKRAGRRSLCSGCRIVIIGQAESLQRHSDKQFIKS